MRTRAGIVILCALGLAGEILAQPLTTSFTYQGELRTGGVPATGVHDLRFRLYDALAGGSQVGSVLCSDNVALSEGRFTVALDFGPVFSGQQRFLEIEVRADTGLDCANPAGFVILGPRQGLTSAPHSIYALKAGSATTAATATNAMQFNGQPASFYQNASNLTSGTLPPGLLGGAYTGALTFSNAGNAFTGSFAGSGSGLTGLNASNVGTGTLGDARLSANVALLNTSQTFTGGKAFSTAPAFTAVGAPFTVSSSTLVTNLNADQLDGLDSAAFLQAVPNPLALSGSSPGASILSGVNTSGTAMSSGVYGRATAAIGTTYGVHGRCDADRGDGVFGEATATSGLVYGVRGKAVSPNGVGVTGLAEATTGSATGVSGGSSSTSGKGVSGAATAASGTTYGVYGSNYSTSGHGVYGVATAATGNTFGGYFRSASTAGVGVFGETTAATGYTNGVWGKSDSTDGIGVVGEASATTGTTFGVYARSESTSGRAVYGRALAESGTTYGVYGISDSTSGRGVFGHAAASSGPTYGVYGQSDSTAGMGVRGIATATSGATFGGHFESRSTTGTAVNGRATATSGIAYGVLGEAFSTSGRAVVGVASANTGSTYGGYFESTSTTGYGVNGRASATTGSNFGGYFESASTSGYGVYGRNSATSGTIYGIRGYASTAASGYAVYAAGDMGASGVKPFRIDHPQDPENKYLLHYATESPEVLNAYSGTVTLDGAGEATVELPAYFASINKDPRYLLTAVGAAMPMLHVAEEISEAALAAGEQAGPGVVPPQCSFRIVGGAPGGRVCWEVKAVRNDLRMRLHGAPVEREKLDSERGRYQHPEYYGMPPERGTDHDAAAVGPPARIDDR